MAYQYLLCAIPDSKPSLSQALGLIIYFYRAKPSENATCAGLLDGTLSIANARAEVDPGDLESFDGECLNFAMEITDTANNGWLTGNIVIEDDQQAIWAECLSTVATEGGFYWRGDNASIGGELYETNHPSIGEVGVVYSPQDLLFAFRDLELN